jgi:hypothetical protein
MTVRMLQNEVVNGSVVFAGAEIEVDAETAVRLLNAKAAEPAASVVEHAVRVPNDTATLPANEAA